MKIHSSLINPESIVVVGGSDNLASPGGRMLDNLLKYGFKGKIFVVNPKKKNVRGLPVFPDVRDLPGKADLALIAVAAKYVEDIVKVLTEEKGTRGFIIISAGFGDAGEEGRQLEKRIVRQIEKYGGSLLGPNNIGLINRHYAGVFTTPVPDLDPQGTDLISGSGATAVFIMEAAMKQGLRFNSVWTVGNSAQIGIEDVLEYLDENFNEQSSRLKLLYIETIRQPAKFLKHARSLTEKGVRIVAIKAGSSQAGSRAASSHTGALATPDTAVQALFEKAGIIRAGGRNELIQLAAVLHYGVPKGKNILIVTHAGGPGVMLADTLEKNGLSVPSLPSGKTEALKEILYPGSSLDNPIDFLATGTAEQLDAILSHTAGLEEIDATAVIFGSPGLFEVYDVYDVLAKHIRKSAKPVYPILPSVINVEKEIAYFHGKGNPSFPDEVLFGKALSKAFYAPRPYSGQALEYNKPAWDFDRDTDGYLMPEDTYKLLKFFDLPVVEQKVFTDVNRAWEFAESKLPVVMKVAGPLHKSDVGGVRLNIGDKEKFYAVFEELLSIPQSRGVLIQAQFEGTELFAGVKKEKGFGHILMFGAGGVFIEVLKDVQTLLLPVSAGVIKEKIKSLKSYPLFEGIRGRQGISTDKFVDLLLKIDAMTRAVPCILEMDLNPVLARGEEFHIVDARVRVRNQEKKA